MYHTLDRLKRPYPIGGMRLAASQFVLLRTAQLRTPQATLQLPHSETHLGHSYPRTLPSQRPLGVPRPGFMDRGAGLCVG